MKALLYTRVSHEEQVKFGYSLEAQKDSLIQYCKDNNLIIRGVYTDEGISGGSITKRKALQRMLNEAERGDIILFTKLDRFSRNLLDANIIVQDLEQKDVSIKAIQEDDIDTTTADGKFIFNLKLSLAQREREKTAERVREVMAYKRSNGQVASGSVPLGYKIIDKQVVIDQETAHIAQFIFKTYDDTNSMHETYRRVCDKFGKGIRSISSYKNILHSRAYIGENRDGVKFCEPLVDRALWERVQKRMEGNVRHSRVGTVYLFSTLIVCPKCGHKLYGHRYAKNDNRIYYHCCSRQLLYGGKCGFTSVREREFEEQLLDQIKLFANRQKRKFAKGKQDIKANKKALERLKTKLERLKELYIDGDIDKAKYVSRKAELEHDINLLQSDIVTVMSETVDTILELNIREVYDHLNRENKRNFWHKFIDKIIIDDDKNIVDIIFHADVGQ